MRSVRRGPVLLLSTLLAAPLAVALPVVSFPGPKPHPVAPKVETWNATGDLQAAATDRFSPRDAVTGTEHHTSSFSLVGVRWSAGGLAPGAQIQVRTRVGSGAWSGWTAAEADDTGPDAGSADAKAAAAVNGTKIASAPIYAGKSDDVQTRVVSEAGDVVSPPASVEVITIDPGTSDADGSAGSAPASTAAAAAATPSIHTRAEWGADESLRSTNPGCGTPQYSDTVRAAVIHHTEGSNDYSPDDVPSILRGIYAFHVIANGYCDIAYNFLVDKFGQIWEGRYGGMGNPVLGAHAGGFNTRTTGVAVIGSYSTIPASPAAISALQVLLAWKLGLTYADPVGRTVLTSAGGEFTVYPEGTPVDVDVITSHRDVDQTSCPGQALYDQLGDIRIGARNLLGTALVTPVIAVSRLGSSANFAAGLTTAANWSFVVRNAAGGVVRTITGNGAGTFGGTWNGTDDAGHFLPVGSYSAELNASGPGGIALPYSVTFLLTGHPGDLALAIASDTGSGQVEVHVLDQASGYQTFTAHAATAIPEVDDPSEWRFLFAPYQHDGQRDLWAIRLAHTQSGKIEVHILSAASGYQTFLLHQALPIAVGATNRFSFSVGSYGGDGDSDLFATFVHGSASGQVEVHVLTEASLFATFSAHFATAMPTSSGSDRDFAVGDPAGRGDLTVVYRDGSAGKTDIHVLNQATGYQTYALHAATALATALPGDEFSLADLNEDGIPDLGLVRLQGGSQHTTEVHVLNGADLFHSFLVHAVAALPEADPSIWTASIVN